MEIIIFKQDKAGTIQYTAACIEDYEKILCRKFTADQIKSEWFDPTTLAPASTELTFENGLTVYPNQILCNLDNLLVIDKRSIEFKKVCLAEQSIDPYIIDYTNNFKTIYPGVRVYTDDVGRNPNTKTIAFVRIPRPETKGITVLPLSELFRLSNKPTMSFDDYTKIKALISSSDKETKQLGLVATSRWNPVSSFEYIVMLAHINKEVLTKEPMFSYLKSISSSVSSTGFSGDLHLDAIDSLCILNSMVRDGDESVYKNDVNGMMSFILNEYSPNTIEQSAKFTFRAKLKSKK